MDMAGRWVPTLPCRSSVHYRAFASGLADVVVAVEDALLAFHRGVSRLPNWLVLVVAYPVPPEPA
jgi:hypothetical protein